MGAKWCEKVLYMQLRKKGGKLNKLDPKYNYGIFLGTSCRTGEHFVGTPDGVVKARSLRRLTEGEKWSGDILPEIKGTPWALVDGEREQPVPIEIQKDLKPESDILVEPKSKACSVRKLMIMKCNVVEFGPTDGCPGCRAVVQKLGPREHSQTCRDRMEPLIQSKPDGAIL